MLKNIFKINQCFHTFSGEDINIIAKLNHPKINRNFNIIGFLVAIICIGCLLSSGIFIFNVLEGASKVLSIPIGIFWGFVITNIYILLLYTISPPLLYHKSMYKKGKGKGKNYEKEKEKFIFKENLNRFRDWLSISLLLRLAFIFIFAIIIAQPINVILFGGKIKNDLELYKMKFKSDMILTHDSMKISEELRLYEEFHKIVYLHNFSKKDRIILDNHTSKIDIKTKGDEFFLKQASRVSANLNKLSKRFDEDAEKQKEKLIVYFHNLIEEQIESDSEYLAHSDKVDFTDVKIQKVFDDYEHNIRMLIEEKHNFNQRTRKTIDDNDFYIRQIVLVNKKVVWVTFFNIIFLFIFIFPIYLKFQVRRIRIKGTKSFYTIKQEQEEKLVKDSYNAFVRRFEKLLSNKYTEWHERARRIMDPELERLEKINPLLTEEINKDIQERYNYSIEFYEKYADPPFNLKEKKKNRIEKTEEEFCKDFNF